MKDVSAVSPLRLVCHFRVARCPSTAAMQTETTTKMSADVLRIATPSYEISFTSFRMSQTGYIPRGDDPPLKDARIDNVMPQQALHWPDDAVLAIAPQMRSRTFYVTLAKVSCNAKLISEIFYPLSTSF